MTTKRLSILGSVLVMAAALLIAAPAYAEEFADKIPDLVWLDIGASVADLTTDVGLTGQSGVGATIDFEKIFNLPGNKTTFMIQGTARVSEHRRHVDFGYVNIDRSGSRVIDQDITWGDYQIDAGGTVTSEFNTEFIYAAFRYDFLHLEPIRISGSAGLSYVDLGSSLSGVGNVNGDPAGSFDKSTSVGLPVPLIGFNVDWALTKGLVFRSYYRFFRLNTNGIDGGMYESGIHLNWYFIRNLGLGVGWDRTELRLNSYESGNDTLKADYTISGVGLYVTMAF
jgi:hypothetical protein